MNYIKLDKEILKDKKLKSNEKLVLIYLIGYNNSELNYSFPTYNQIKEDTGISIKTLAKIFNSLEDKGYIKRANNPNRSGRNNVYYIYKYVVVNKYEDITVSEPIGEDLSNESTNNSNDITETVSEPSANQLLLENKANINHNLTSEQLKQLNNLDTDKLIRTINQANKFAEGKYSFNYLIAIYNNFNAKKQSRNNYYNNNKSINTRYHNSFNEHYKNYSHDELEEKLLKMQEQRRLKNAI